MKYCIYLSSSSTDRMCVCNSQQFEFKHSPNLYTIAHYDTFFRCIELVVQLATYFVVIAD